MSTKPHPKTLASTIARIVHGLLAAEPFESLPDLTDALKYRLARYRIRWTNEDLNDAYRLVATARALPGRTLQRRPTSVERRPERLDPPKAEAEALWEAFGGKRGATIRTMPTGPSAEAQRAHEAKVRAQADEMRRLPTKRRPIAERLAEIFE